MQDHLEKAKAFLKIAESGDSKKAAYMAAAEEIAAHMDETGDNLTVSCKKLGRTKSTVSKLLSWRQSGYEAETPFLMDGNATKRAALSHTKAVLRDADPTEIAGLIPEEKRQAVVVEAVKNDPAVREAVARDNEANRQMIGAIAQDGLHRREEADTRSRAVIDPDMIEKPGPWGLVIKASRALHKAFEHRWNDDLSWGKLWMNGGEDAVRWQLGELESMHRIITRMRDTGRAFIRTTIDQDQEVPQ
jgi:hypothetical protein